MKKFLIAAATLCFASVASAADHVAFSKDGEYLYAESTTGNKAFPAVVGVLEKAGYTRQDSSVILPQTKTDTWCKVSVDNEREILGECYTPHQGHGISVRNHTLTFKADYSRVPVMVAQIRDEHRRASAYLGIK